MGARYSLLLNPSSRYVRLLLDCHHGDGGVYARGQRDLDGVLVAVDADAHVLLDVRGGNLSEKRKDCVKPSYRLNKLRIAPFTHLVTESDDKLGVLAHVDDILGIILARVDYLCASRHLERVLLLQQPRERAVTG